MTTSPQQGIISLSRARDRYDRLRRYQVVVDGAQVAAIKRGERLDLPVTPGRHSIFLRISWARSPELDVEVAPGEVIPLECGGRVCRRSVPEPTGTVRCGAPTDPVRSVRRSPAPRGRAGNRRAVDLGRSRSWNVF